MNTVMSEQFIVTMFPIIKSLADAKGRPAALMLDNAPYHGRAISKVLITPPPPPTTTSRKENEGRLGNTVFYLDTEAANYGVQIIRTPLYHCFLNPIELFWARLKAFLRSIGKTSNKLPLVRQRVIDFCHDFSSTDAAALYRHVDNYVDEIRDTVRQKGAEDADEESDQECMGAGLFGDSSFDEVLESDVSEEF
uniref:Tc1-like transposase DDE domain-containing protein n=1 Tax=Caenorhabditis japonica TaxID=281687 RepID=A0A8R1I2K1_CAEJA